MKLSKYVCVFIAICSVAATAMAPKNTISLKGLNVEYIFNSSEKYNLQELRYKGKVTGLKGGGTLYQLVEDVWSNSKTMPKEWRLGKFDAKLQKNTDKTTLTVKAVSPKLKVTHIYEIKKGTDSLDAYTTLETTDPERLRWCYMDAFSFPATVKFIRGENITRNGKVSVKTTTYQESIFLNPDGTRKYVAPYKYKIKSLYNEPVVGFLNKAQNCGIIMTVKPADENLHFFRTGQSTKDMRYYASLLNEKMTISRNGKWYYMKSSMTIYPFSESTEKLHKTVVVPLFNYLHQRGLTFGKKGTSGKKLPSSKLADLWVDLPTATIVKSEEIPQDKANSIKISLAGGETEGVQLVLKPSQKNLSKVTIRFSALTCGKYRLPNTAISYNPIEYFNSKFACTTMDTIGEVPDVLLPAKPVDCPKKIASVFYIRISAPYNVTAGVYNGEMTVLAENKQLFKIPLSVKIWNFSLPEKASIMSHPDIWDAITHRFYEDPEQARKAVKDCNNLLKYARSSRRWVSTPKPYWDNNGKLLEIDFRKFDKETQEQFSFYGQPYVITRAFMLGYGHKLRKTLFGPKKAILTPEWKSKMTEYAKRFLQHIKEKGWQDKVIIDLFDEPDREEVKVICSTVKLLREINPKWRFTAPTYYIPPLKGTLNYWNFDRYYPSTANLLEKQGDTITIYNPPATRAGCSLANIRAYGWFLHRYNIKYTYQWCTNIWREWKERNGLDINRSASWVTPGPEGVRSTMRYETMRDYLEDYEFLVLLKKAIKKAEKEKMAKKVKTAKKLLKQAKAIAKVPANEAIPYMANQNPRAIPELREKIGNFISSMKL